MSNKILIIILIISVAINLAAVFTLGYYWISDTRRTPFVRRPYDRRAEVHHRFIAREVGLDKAQIEQLNEMREKMAEVMGPIQREIVSRRRELMDLLRQSDPDTARAAMLLKEISTLQTEHERKAFEAFTKVKEMLTPEQQEKLGAILDIFMQRCPVPDHECPGGPPPGPMPPR
jgi:Spy/CpxP family protein refolding chaperone